VVDALKENGGDTEEIKQNYRKLWTLLFRVEIREATATVGLLEDALEELSLTENSQSRYYIMPDCSFYTEKGMARKKGKKKRF
jgi:hypothetical protein